MCLQRHSPFLQSHHSHWRKDLETPKGPPFPLLCHREAGQWAGTWRQHWVCFSVFMCSLLPQTYTNCYNNKNVCCSLEPHIQQSILFSPLSKACSPLSQMHSTYWHTALSYQWMGPPEHHLEHLIEQRCPTQQVTNSVGEHTGDITSFPPPKFTVIQVQFSAFSPNPA